MPGVIQYDKNCNAIGDIGQKIQTGDVHLDDIFVILIKLMDLASKLAGSIAVCYLMYGGFQYVTSGFTDAKEDAKNTIKWAIVGLFVTFFAWLIITVIKSQLPGTG